MKNNKKILSLMTLTICLVFCLCSCKTANNVVDEKASEQTENSKYVVKNDAEKKSILNELVNSTDKDLDTILSIDDVSKYNFVGTISGGKELYAFNNISYMDLVKRFESRMDTNVLNQELYLRGFYVVSNNICFSTDSDFIKKQKLYLSDFAYFEEIDKTKIIEKIPYMEERITKLENSNYEELGFYKTTLTSDESVVNKDDSHSYEVIYVLGRQEGIWRILDCAYDFNGKIEYKQYSPHISVDMVENFVPNTFSKKQVNN